MIYYICVLDFEATCFEHNETPRDKMEIIEFPSILYKVDSNTNSFEVIEEFHQYVKPTYRPILTKFCKDLTGIQQSTIDSANTIEFVYQDHINWIKKYVKPSDELIFATCGYWDLKTMLRNEVKNKNLVLNPIYKKYINVKDEYEYFFKRKTRSMSDMLTHLNIPLVGRLHSGIDDTRNIAKIVEKMIKDKHHDFQIIYLIR
jgi:inhibitor of KinA sporulation pathway (predicted exonuclease)